MWSKANGTLKIFLIGLYIAKFRGEAGSWGHQ